MKRFFVLLLVIAFASPFGLFARDLDSQNPEWDSGDSPTKATTGSRFGTDFDNYLSVTDWSAIEGNVLFLQYGAPNEDGTGSFQGGTGYFLGNGMYLGGFLGLQIPSTTADKEETLVDDSSIIISDGEPVGVRETKQTSVKETMANETQFDFMFGLPVGDISIGLRNELELDKEDKVGTVGLTGGLTFGGGAGIFSISDASTRTDWWFEFNATEGADYNDWYWQDDFDVNLDEVGPIGFGLTYTASKETVSQSGTVTYENVDEYADDGFINDNAFSDEFTAGATIPIGSINLDASLGFRYALQNYDAEGSYISYERDANNGLPTYEEKTGVIEYGKESGTQTVNYTDMEVPVSIVAYLPVGENAEFGIGASYTPTFRMYNDPISQEYAASYYQASYDNQYIDTTLNEAELDYSAEITDSGHWVSMPISIEIAPSDKFRYSIRYQPVFGMRSVEVESSMSVTKTTTSDYGDPSTQDTVVNETYTSEGRVNTVNAKALLHDLNLGAQFYLKENFRINMGTALKAQQIEKIENTVEQKGETTYVQNTSYDGGDAVQTDYDYAEDIDQGVSDTTETNAFADGAPSIDYSIGFTYFFSENMELDVEYDANSGSIWDLGRWSALMTIRY